MNPLKKILNILDQQKHILQHILHHINFKFGVLKEDIELILIMEEKVDILKES